MYKYLRKTYVFSRFKEAWGVLGASEMVFGGRWTWIGAGRLSFGAWWLDLTGLGVPRI